MFRQRYRSRRTTGTAIPIVSLVDSGKRLFLLLDGGKGRILPAGSISALYLMYTEIMKKTLSIALLTMFLGLISAVTVHEVSAQKNALYLVNFGTVNLDLSRTTAAGNLVPDEDSNTRLVWTEPSYRSKVTVSTFAPDQKFILTAEATRVKNGKSVGAVRLVDGMLDTDLIINIKKKKSGWARISYRAESSIQDGNSMDDGMDVHTVTFTLTEI